MRSRESTTGREERILLVEDNAEALTALRRTLEWHGYSVVQARDASEAEALFTAYPEPIHLMVADVVLPDRSGVVLAERLAQLRPGLRVLFLSGYAQRELSLDARGIGPSAFLEKPVTIRRLGEEVRRLLDTPWVMPPSREGEGGPSGFPSGNQSVRIERA